MTRQLLTLLIVVALLAIMVRVYQQWGSEALVGVTAIPTPTASGLSVVPADGTLPTALPPPVATAVVATVQAARVTATLVGQGSRPQRFPDTGVAEVVSWGERLPFLVFITCITAVTVVGTWLGRKR